MTATNVIKKYLLVSTFIGLAGCGQASRFSYQQAQSSQTGASLSQPASPLPIVVPSPRPSSAANLTVCAAGSSTPGTDVSDYDSNTQWTTVAHGGIGFAFIKATEGTNFTNSQFAGDWASSKNAGVYRGAYHFFHPADDPTLQAQYYLNTMGPLEKTDLPAMLDWEVTDGVSANMQMQNAMTWLQLVEASTGKIPVIYTGPGFWNALGNPTGFQRYPLYIAHYNVRCPSVPAPWSNWVFWQTGQGPVPGLADTQADQDIFNGSPAQLGQFVLTGARPN